MCNKVFQTQLKDLAKLKAEMESERLGKRIRAYFCHNCRLWGITSQQKKSKKERTKRRDRAIVCAWENEGGALHPSE